MAGKYKCQLCEDEFMILLELQEHMRWHDQLTQKSKQKVKRPSKTEELGLTREPTPEEVLGKNRRESPTGEYARPSLKDVVRPVPPPPVTVAKPIQLKYKYEGQCPTCKGDVVTIEIDLDEKNAVSAYCVACDKKIAQKLVTPIAKQ